MSYATDPDCLFCKIVAGEIPSEKVYEDDLIYAFKDINPGAPIHILFIPKEHIPTANDLTEDHKYIIGHIYVKAAEVAKDLGIADDGYRLVNNCNELAGQTVFHLHIHLLAGRALSWPPG